MSEERHTIWVFEPAEAEEDNDRWFKIELPYSDDFAEALHEGDRRAWGAILTGLHSLVDTARHAC